MFSIVIMQGIATQSQHFLFSFLVLGYKCVYFMIKARHTCTYIEGEIHMEFMTSVSTTYRLFKV